MNTKKPTVIELFAGDHMTILDPEGGQIAEITPFDEKGKAQSATLKPIAPITDFSYDFEDLFLKRTK